MFPRCKKKEFKNIIIRRVDGDIEIEYIEIEYKNEEGLYRLKNAK